MPVSTIPLVGQPDFRGIAYTSKDTHYEGCYFSIFSDSLRGQAQAYSEKRVGWVSQDTVNAGVAGIACANFGGSNGAVLSFNDGKIYRVASAIKTLMGDINPLKAINFSIISLNNAGYAMFIDDSGQGYYLAFDAIATTLTFTGDTHTNTTIDNISSMTGLHIGQLLTGTNMAAGTRIATINVAGLSITTTLATTGTNVGVTITRTGISKIIDADFPTNCSGHFVEKNGYVLINTLTNKVYQSDLNNVDSWTATNVIQLTPAPSPLGSLGGLAKLGTFIAAFSKETISFLFYAGNPSGSVFSENDSLRMDIGCGSGSVATRQVAICQLGPYTAFIGAVAGSDGNNSVYLFERTNLKKISTQAIETAISNGENMSISMFRHAGQTFVYLSQSSSITDFLYSVENNVWTRPKFANVHYISAVTNISGPGDIVSVNSSTGGKWFKLTAATFTDDGSAYTMTLQTQPHYLNGGKGFFINDVELIADTQASGTTTFSKSVDDYASFVTLEAFDMTANKKISRRGGYCRSHVAFKLEHSAATAWRGQALKVNWTPAQT